MSSILHTTLGTGETNGIISAHALSDHIGFFGDLCILCMEAFGPCGRSFELG
jgi:hypothetical protein